MINVAIALIVQGDKVLISQRGNNVAEANKWEFPGGKCEAHESPFEALTREIEEEVGLTIKSATLVDTALTGSEETPIKLHFYYAEQFTGEAVAKEGQPLQWCEIARLDEYDFPTINAAIIDWLIKQ